MNIYIYESSSKGGCYEYSKYLLKAYKKENEKTFLILPKSCPDQPRSSLKFLISDTTKHRSKLVRKAYFLLRQFLNPLILFFFLLTKNKSFVILNDFEQLSAPLWAPLYKIFLRKHVFAVVLHDPDRDNYPPSRKLSEYCMKKLMSSMDLGLYHEYLPDKKYYKEGKSRYLKVPHGLFSPTYPDPDLFRNLRKEGADCKLMSIIGNIRDEKNYSLAIEALTGLPDWKLVVAGAPANSAVAIENYKKLAAEKGVSNRVIWIEKFLSDVELAAVISASDLVLLYYKKSFTSQSGILNLVAPFEKKVLIADTSSSLAEVGKKFNLGVLAVPDDLEALKNGIVKSETFECKGWSDYKEYASWERHVAIVLSELNNTKK